MRPRPNVPTSARTPAVTRALRLQAIADAFRGGATLSVRDVSERWAISVRQAYRDLFAIDDHILALAREVAPALDRGHPPTAAYRMERRPADEEMPEVNEWAS